MYIYNYIDIWLAARNVKNPPANKYGCVWKMSLTFYPNVRVEKALHTSQQSIPRTRALPAEYKPWQGLSVHLFKEEMG